MKKLELLYPINNPTISQKFGVGQSVYSDPKYGGLQGHNGIDFVASHGSPVYASHDGLASFQIDSGGGHGVVIITDTPFDNGLGGECYFKTIYWHLCDGLKEPLYASPFQGKTGFSPISTGELIGYADNTGASTGDHLHFGLKQVEKGENWGVWYNLNQQNGYLGAIDPFPYLDKFTPFQFQTMKKEINLLQMVVELYKKLIGK